MKEKYSQEFDADIRGQLKASVENISPCPYTKNTIKNRIAHLDNSQGGCSMKINSGVKVAAALAFCLIFGGVGAYATGALTGSMVGSSSYSYTNYNQVDTAKKKAGFETPFPKTLSQDFYFKEIEIQDVKDLDDQGNSINERKALSVTYENSQGQALNLYLDKKYDNSQDISNEPYTQIRDIEGRKLYFTRLESLFLSDESQMTPEEEERSKKDPFFNVAFGGEGTEREISISHHLSFTDKGITYSLMTDEMVDANTLYRIGAEILQ